MYLEMPDSSRRIQIISAESHIWDTLVNTNCSITIVTHAILHNTHFPSFAQQKQGVYLIMITTNVISFYIVHRYLMSLM